MERGDGRAHANWDFPGTTTTTSAGLCMDPILLSFRVTGGRPGCKITLRLKQLFTSLQIIFEGRRGSTEQSDVAIDDVKLYYGPCTGR